MSPMLVRRYGQSNDYGMIWFDVWENPALDFVSTSQVLPYCQQTASWHYSFNGWGKNVNTIAFDVTTHSLK